uniref:Uncharacterized protein n=1 Tax=Pararge aegeria TaxID=116150 RepID=S4PDS8_9NEOP
MTPRSILLLSDCDQCFYHVLHISSTFPAQWCYIWEVPGPIAGQAVWEYIISEFSLVWSGESFAVASYHNKMCAKRQHSEFRAEIDYGHLTGLREPSRSMRNYLETLASF